MTASVLVAIVADTHGVLDARVAARVRQCDYAVHAGDIGAAAVLEALKPRTAVVAVTGNNDLPSKWPRDEAAVLAGLQAEQRLELPGGELVVVHGHRAGTAAVRHRRLRRSYPQARAVVYGHSHRLVIDDEQRPWVLNPGAAGRARTYGGPSCLILRAGARIWRVEALRFDPAPRKATGR